MVSIDTLNMIRVDMVSIDKFNMIRVPLTQETLSGLYNKCPLKFVGESSVKQDFVNSPNSPS